MIDFRHLHAGPASFWLMRHGQSGGNVKGVPQGRADHPLTDLGRLQAREAGAWLRGQGIELVLSSPLSRARETAEIVAEASGAEGPVAVEELTEIDTGVFTDLPWTDIPVRLANEYRRFQLKGWEGVEGAERAAGLSARAAAAWAVLCRYYEEGRRNVLAVSHAGFLQWLIRLTFGHETWMPLFGSAGNCGVSRLKVENKPVDGGLFSYYAEWTMINAKPWNGKDG
jgi:broad specificity phosphatase PhoE